MYEYQPNFSLASTRFYLCANYNINPNVQLLGNNPIALKENYLGIITEAIVRVRPLPEVKIYDSILFYDFEQGIKFMYEVSQLRQYPASCRLVDN